MNGAEVTGIVIMCLRKIQNYSPNFAIVEIQRCGFSLAVLSTLLNACNRHLREGVFTHEMLEFYERFNNEVTIPAVIPSWLWEGQRRGQTSKAAVRLLSLDRANADLWRPDYRAGRRRRCEHRDGKRGAALARVQAQPAGPAERRVATGGASARLFCGRNRALS